MKKITTIPAVALLAISVISCSKSSSAYIPDNSSDRGGGKAEPVKVRIISDWQTLAFNSSTANGLSQLQGQSTLTYIVSYETGMHKQLAYLKMRGREGFVYRALPTNHSTTGGNYVFNFSLDFSTFKVSISDRDLPARPVNAQDLSGFQYRYIVIPVEVYQSFQINWDDLTEVASALGFSL